MKAHPRVLFDPALLCAVREKADGTEELSRLIVWERAFKHYPAAERLRLEKLPGRTRRLAFLHPLRGLDARRALELARAMLRAAPVTFRGKVAWVESLAQVCDWCFDALGELEAEVAAKVETWGAKIGPASAAEAASAAAALLAAGAALEGDAAAKLFERGESLARSALEDAAEVPLDGLEALARAERVLSVFSGGSLNARARVSGCELPPELPPALAWLLDGPRAKGAGVYGLVFVRR